jgi:hypothetical protein
MLGTGFMMIVAVLGGVFFGRILGPFYGLVFTVGLLGMFFFGSLSEAAYGQHSADRRRPNRHRWLTNGLKPRWMHWGPRRLF